MGHVLCRGHGTVHTLRHCMSRMSGRRSHLTGHRWPKHCTVLDGPASIRISYRSWGAAVVPYDQGVSDWRVYAAE